MQKVTIALVIVCAILAFFAFDFYLYSDELVGNYNRLVDNYNRLVDNYNKLLERAYIENENATISFHTSDGTFYKWTVALETLESQIYLSWYKKETGDFQYIDLRDNETGKIHHMVDFRPFVIENNFATVIPNLYQDLKNNNVNFVYEVWYIVAQLTTYRSEITETPKFPLQTLITGGGDCEDMAVLIASMLKAAPENYVVKLVYMDADNPTAPENVNHVVVWVETPSSYKTFVDGTSHTEMCPFTEVVGWYFEV